MSERALAEHVADDPPPPKSERFGVPRRPPREVEPYAIVHGASLDLAANDAVALSATKDEPGGER